MTAEADHFYLNRYEIHGLLDRLRALPWIATELDTVIIRDTRYHDKHDRPTTTTPVPFHLGASDVAWDMRDTLRTWVNEVATQRHLPWPGEYRADHYARWLDRHVMHLAQIENAPDAADEIRDIHKRALRAIDRPQDFEFVGPCQSDVPGVACDGVYAPRGADTKNCADCMVCIDIPAVQAATRQAIQGRLYTGKELATALTISTGEPVPFERVRNWIRRHKLLPSSTVGPALYSLDEAQELAMAGRQRKKRIA